MIDHGNDNNTATTTRKRLLRGLAAAGMAVLPATVLATAAPAGADPGPLTIGGTACEVHASGEGYDVLDLTITHNGQTAVLMSTVLDHLVAGYGGTWILPIGDVATFTVDGWVDGQVVASETIERGTCGAAAGRVILSVWEDGADVYSANIYKTRLADCADDVFAPVIDVVPRTTPRSVPVLAGRTYCATPVEIPASVTSLTITPEQAQSSSLQDAAFIDILAHHGEGTPGNEEPGTEEPGTEEPGTEESGTGESGDRPGHGKPADRPTHGKPADTPGKGKPADTPGHGRSGVAADSVASPMPPVRPEMVTVAAQADDDAEDLDAEDADQTDAGVLPGATDEAGLGLVGGALTLAGAALLRARRRFSAGA